MTEKTFTSTFQIFDNLEELPTDIQNLMAEACRVRDKAYAPYSNFQVGAAVLLENGKIISGSNQENASYPSGLCAERTAIYYAGAQFPEQKIHSLALSAKSLLHQTTVPIPPCGACRQAIAEYETKQNQPITIYFMGETGKIIRSASLANLLPLAFDRTFL
ncbi:MAG TPA: cytidine deaminase [Flavobacteriaceae bacterium]|nr:cytidine deaminase [Flavobacteriaceae bacterium]